MEGVFLQYSSCCITFLCSIFSVCVRMQIYNFLPMFQLRFCNFLPMVWGKGDLWEDILTYCIQRMVYLLPCGVKRKIRAISPV